MSETVVLLHGFATTHRLWEPVAGLLERERYRPLAPDLPGHGRSGGSGPFSLDACVGDLTSGLPDRFVLCGYSLGGRIAQHLALACANRVVSLVLVSATAGIDGDAERQARRASDEQVARQLEADGIEPFIERWAGAELFADDPPTVRAAIEVDQRRSKPAGLAAALRAFGSGSCPPLWDRLAELTMPVAVLAGGRDGKYVALGERLVAGLPDARLTVVPGAGHRLPLEAAQVVAGACMRPQ